MAVILLCADDDPVTREAYTTWLGAAGYAVKTAVHGGEVLLLLDEGLKPDLILLDLVMPGMDGNETMAALRYRGCTVPVVLVSAYLDDAGLHLGPPVAGGLPKPISRAKLLDVVSGVLERHPP